MVGRGGLVAPWKIGRDKRPRLSHFPPEGEVSWRAHEPRFSTAHAGGQVGRPGPSDPTIEMVGRGGPAAPWKIGRDKRPRLSHFPPEGEMSCSVHAPRISAAHAGGQVGAAEAVRPYHRRVGRGSLAAPWKIGRDKRPRLSHFPPEGEVSGAAYELRISTAHAGGPVGRPRPTDPTIEMVGRGGPAAPWKIGRDKRPRLSHFPPEGEMSCSVHAPRISAAHAGGQVGRPRPSDPTIEMVGRGGLAAPTFPPRARCYGLIMNRALAAAHAGG